MASLGKGEGLYTLFLSYKALMGPSQPPYIPHSAYPHSSRTPSPAFRSVERCYAVLPDTAWRLGGFCSSPSRRLLETAAMWIPVLRTPSHTWRTCFACR